MHIIDRGTCRGAYEGLGIWGLVVTCGNQCTIEKALHPCSVISPKRSM